MRTSKRGIDFIKSAEGYRANKYRDTAGKWTIGYGHLILPWENFDGGISKEEAENILIKDLESAENDINNLVTVDLNQNQFDALVSFVFNIGGDALQGSQTLGIINSGMFDDVPKWLSKWNKVTKNGKKVVDKGLVNRRKKESDLFREPVSEGI